MSKAKRSPKLCSSICVGLVLLIAGSTLTSCSSARLRLSSGAGPCYQVLPAAQNAVTSQKTYLGVRLIANNTAQSILSKTISPTQPYYCLIAYRLIYQNATTLSLPRPTFALVIVSPNTKQVIGVKEVARLPFSFRRSISIR
ncbi:MAG: hypothetical protein HKL84_03230 [Acidimicrobiaceae bacterium]|nr:hypothetical protein [Acidimicrobiaceae bacterium]